MELAEHGIAIATPNPFIKDLAITEISRSGKQQIRLWRSLIFFKFLWNVSFSLYYLSVVSYMTRAYAILFYAGIVKMWAMLQKDAVYRLANFLQVLLDVFMYWLCSWWPWKYQQNPLMGLWGEESWNESQSKNLKNYWRCKRICFKISTCLHQLLTFSFFLCAMILCISI